MAQSGLVPLSLSLQAAESQRRAETRRSKRDTANKSLSHAEPNRPVHTLQSCDETGPCSRLARSKNINYFFINIQLRAVVINYKRPSLSPGEPTSLITFQCADRNTKEGAATRTLSRPLFSYGTAMQRRSNLLRSRYKPRPPELRETMQVLEALRRSLSAGGPLTHTTAAPLQLHIV